MSRLTKILIKSLSVLMLLAFVCGGADLSAAVKKAKKPTAKNSAGKVYDDVVEVMPQFPGGGDAALAKWISDNMIYPAFAKINEVQGRVVVSVVINEDGSVSDIKVVKSVSPELDNEAIRLCESLPKFKPGTQYGRPVKVRYTIPITFKL